MHVKVGGTRITLRYRSVAPGRRQSLRCYMNDVLNQSPSLEATALLPQRQSAPTDIRKPQLFSGILPLLLKPQDITQVLTHSNTQTATPLKDVSQVPLTSTHQGTSQGHHSSAHSLQHTNRNTPQICLSSAHSLQLTNHNTPQRCHSSAAHFHSSRHFSKMSLKCRSLPLIKALLKDVSQVLTHCSSQTTTPLKDVSQVPLASTHQGTS